MRSRSFWVALGLAVAAAGAGVYWLNDAGHLNLNGTPAAQVTATPAAKAVNATVVEATPVIIDEVIDAIHAVGTLRANEAVVIAPEVAGRIAQIGFTESTPVRTGDMLFELDASILRAELVKTESELKLADANRERALTLAKQGTGTLRARDEAVAAYSAANANLELARARLEKATIVAPFDGVVGLRAVSVGAYVSPGDRLVELADIDPIKVDFRVPELALSDLRPGQSIRTTVDAVPDEEFIGTVYAIDPIVDQEGRAIRMRAEIPNPDRVLLPGLFARVQIILAKREQAVLVPESAIFARGGQQYVFKVIENKATLTKVELGQRRPGDVEVVAGLSRGAVVVTAGHDKIRDNGLVEMKPPRGAN
jgi:membrane fusion protein, multidrug efflux system